MNMNRNVIYMTIFVIFFTVSAQKNSNAQFREKSISADKLKWILVTDDLFPKTVLSHLNKNNWRPLDFAFIKNTGTEKGSLIVGSATGYSGGRMYAVFEKRKSHWINVGEFQGWFILTMPDSAISPLYKKEHRYRINSYSRHGEEFLSIYDYINGRYRLTNQIENPLPTERTWHMPEVHYYSKPMQGEYRQESFKEYID